MTADHDGGAQSFGPPPAYGPAAPPAYGPGASPGYGAATPPGQYPMPGQFPPPGQSPPPGQYPHPGQIPPPPQYAPQPVPTGPEFVAFDKTNALVIDGEGVSFDLGGQVTDHPWEQITALHYTAQGVHLRVGITHAAGWFHECVINAKKQQKLIAWLTELGPVAAYYQAQLLNRA